MKPLDGKVAIITGGARGIGRAICVAMADAGAQVAVADLSRAEADEVAQAIGGIAVEMDVTDFSNIAAGVDEVERTLGGVDILVNNAGITRDATFHKMTKDQWDQVIGTNLNGLFNMTHPLWPGMRERGFGRVINISSINGQKGQMGQANYSAAKAGDIGFTKALAQEGAFKGVTVNAICPGYIATDMVMAVPEKVRESIIAQIPVGRLGETQDIARCVVFLASDDAGFITGATLTANGGQYLT